MESDLSAYARKFSSPQETPIWLFDLDNTLYRTEAGLMDAISDRINLFIEQQLNLPSSIAEDMRQAYYGSYGSSVLGLLKHCHVNHGEFMAFIHDLPVEEYLPHDDRLLEMLCSLPGNKYIFTNAPARYASRVLRALGIEACFEDIYDIHFAGLEGKPAPKVYEMVLSDLGPPVGDCWFIEDSLANLLPAEALGCRTVWITSDEGTQPEFVEYMIRDLAELQGIVRRVYPSNGT